jgi:hypothetical protein
MTTYKVCLLFLYVVSAEVSCVIFAFCDDQIEQSCSLRLGLLAHVHRQLFRASLSNMRLCSQWLHCAVAQGICCSSILGSQLRPARVGCAESSHTFT